MLHRTLPAIEDDTEEAPWMVMSDWQYHAATIFYYSLMFHLGSQAPRPYIAAMLPIRFRPDPARDEVRQLSPDVLVSFVPLVPRSSYDLEQEGVPQVLSWR